MENAFLAYDLSAIILNIINGANFIRTNPGRNRRFNLFLCILLTGSLVAVWDIARIIMSQTEQNGSNAWGMMSALYMASLFMITILYLAFIFETTETWHLIGKKLYRRLVLIIPTVMGAVFVICGFVAPLKVLLNVNADATVNYEWGYYVLYIQTALFLLFAFAYIFRIRKYIGNKFERMFKMPVYVIIVALIWQVTFPRHHVTAFAISVDMILLTLLSRRAEEALDVGTGLQSYRAFAQKVEMEFNTGKQMEFVFVSIIGFEHLVRELGYDTMTGFTKQIADELGNIMKRYHVPNACFYNGNGKFAVELGKRQFSQISEICLEIAKYVKLIVEEGLSKNNIKINISRSKCPEDINDLETLFMFITDADKYYEDGKILSAADIIQTKDFVMRREMSAILDRALSNHYFSVFYQPIFDTKRRRFASAEALIRLRDPKYGYISPGVFIPMAEKSGAIHAIGSFVIDEVCKFIASEEFEKLQVDYIEINLSVMQCLRTDLADEIIGAAKKYGIDPKKLNLEITETASAYSQEKLLGNVEALKEAGFTFSLDDFGTGYSNLMRITSLPLSIIKLDRTFVLLEEQPGFHATLFNLIGMLKDMGKNVLIEGVETKEMADTFILLGVDEIQGFYYSKPLSKDEYVKFVSDSLKV